MAFTEKITLLVDVVTGNSKSSLGKLKTDLKAADGAFAKTKASASAMGGFLKQNVGLIAAGAGAAIAGFAADAVGDFQDLALGAGRLRDSLGVTAEEASRLQEVGQDLGIPVEALEKSIGRMNRAAEETPEAFDNIGASIARGADGAVDVNQTFLNTIDALNRIPDATQRAAAAQKIFGRGWMEISELIQLGGDGVIKKFEEVGDSKIVNDAQIAESRQLRDSFEDMKDAASTVGETIGAAVIPILNDLVGIAHAVAGAIEAIPFKDQAVDIAGWVTGITPLVKGIGLVNSGLEDLTGTTHGTYVGLTNVTGAMTPAEEAALKMAGAEAQAARETEDLYESASEAAPAVAYLKQQQEDAEQAARDHADALQESADAAQAAADAMRASVDAGFALRDAQREAADAAAAVDEVLADEDATLADLGEALDKSSQAAINAADAQVELARQRAAERGETLSSTAAQDIFNRSLINQAGTLKGPARDALVDHIAELNNIPPKKASEIQALIDEGKLGQAKRKLADASAPRKATVTADAETAAAKAELDQLDNTRSMTLLVNPTLTSGIVPRQHGGTVNEPLTMVGEAGPELVTLPAGSRVHTNAQSARMLGIQSFQHGGTVRPTRATRQLLSTAKTAARQANALEPQIKALQELAEATDNAEEKEKLLEEREKLLEKRHDLLEKATDKASAAVDRHAKTIGVERAELEREIGTLQDHADKLRDQADAARDAAAEQADALRDLAAARSDALAEQASSLREAYDAEEALEDARRSAAQADDALVDSSQRVADARKAAAAADKTQTVDGVTTYVHSVEERKAAAKALADAETAQAQASIDAKEAERDAAVAVSDAEVELARQRAEARGEEFTALDAIAVQRKSLQRQGHPQLIKALGLDRAAALAKEAAAQAKAREAKADQLEKQADKRADKLERAANKDEANANKMEKAANHLDRVANRFPLAISRAFARANRQNLTEAELTRLINRILAGS